MRLFGRDQTLNLSSLLLLFPFVDTILRNLKELSLFERQKEICRVCGRTISRRGGIFCGNFSSPRGHWEPCLEVWCGKRKGL